MELDSASRVGRERRARYLAQEGLPDDVARFDERAFVRKAQYMFAWDWGPRLVSAGIWRGVELVEHAGRLLDVRVTQEHLPSGSVELRFDSRFEGEGAVLHVIDGVDGPVLDGQRVVIEQPALWWPAGLGQPAL